MREEDSERSYVCVCVCSYTHIWYRKKGKKRRFFLTRENKNHHFADSAPDLENIFSESFEEDTKTDGTLYHKNQSFIFLEIREKLLGDIQGEVEIKKTHTNLV